MTIIPPPRATINASPAFDFIAGRFSDSTVPVSYFVTVMKYSAAATSLKLISELPGASDLNWSIEELYQREVDWVRVTRSIVPYLRQSNQAQFFNAITVALLPQRQGQILTMSDGEWSAPALPEPDKFSQNGCIKSFGPITCGYWGKWTNPADPGAGLGCIAWNLDEVAAVAIDGQHRLAAIKALHRTSGNSTSSVPVILVVSHPDLGTATPASRSSSLALTRKLFIDLNKHSIKVSRARQILLDDRDPVSTCTRSLVGQALKEGKDDLSDHRVPLTLVDWHSEQAKIDVGPYLVTILGLDWIVEQCIEIPSALNAMSFDLIKQTIQRVDDSLGVQLPDAMQRLENAQATNSPFEFIIDGECSELDLIEEGFCRSWSPAIVYILTNLDPYSKLITLRTKESTLVPGFAGWWAARSKTDSSKPGPAGDALATIEAELNNRKDPRYSPVHFEKSIDKFAEFKGEYELAFAVAFQRAVFGAFLKYLKARLISDDRSNGAVFGAAETDPQTPLSVAETKGKGRLLNAHFFVAAINRLSKHLGAFYKKSATIPGRGNRRLWSGSLFRDEDESIDFTAVASNRAADLLLAAVYLEYIRKHPRDGSVPKFGQLWAAVQEASAGDGAYYRLRLVVQRMSKEGIGERIAKGKNPPITDEEEFAKVAEEEVQKRLEGIWKALGEPE